MTTTSVTRTTTPATILSRIGVVLAGVLAIVELVTTIPNIGGPAPIPLDWAVSSFVDDLFVDFRPRLRSGRSTRFGSRRGFGSRGWSGAVGGCRTPRCTALPRTSPAVG